MPSRKNKCGGKSSKKQKLWKQKGCSKSKKSKKSKLRRYKMKGGGCGCGMPVQTGGAASLPAVPTAFQGSSWGSNVSQWPGVGNNPHNGSWLSYNNRYYDPQTQGIVQENQIENQFTAGKPNPHYMSGGSSRKYKKNSKSKKSKSKKGNSRRKKMSGGGLLGNLSQNIQFGVGSAWNTVGGYPAPVDPRPYVQSKLLNGTLL
jgi:hypothetical protein